MYFMQTATAGKITTQILGTSGQTTSLTSEERSFFRTDMKRLT